MEDTFRNNWRVVAVPLITTAVVIGSAILYAFS
jgi:hypothetical protein